MFYKIIYLLLIPTMKLLYRYTIYGKQNIPQKGPVILTANHMSYLDPIMIALAAGPRTVNFMGKESLLKIPLFGSFLRALNTFPVKKDVADKAAIVKSLKILSQGEVLLIFPEGTRHRNGVLGPAYPGVASIALKTGTPIVPIGIIGTDKVLPDGGKMFRFPKLKARIGKAIAVDKVGTQDRKEKEIELTNKMMEEIGNLIAGG